MVEGPICFQVLDEGEILASEGKFSVEANNRAIYLVHLKCSNARTFWLSLNYFLKLETNRKDQFSSFL